MIDIIETKSDPRALRIYQGEGTTIYYVRLQLLANECEELIGTLSRSSVLPRISSPRLPTEETIHFGSAGGTTISLSLGPIESLIKDLDWADQVRIYHGMCRAFFEFGMPSEVYVAFHQFLGNSSWFPISECIDAWVPGTGPGYNGSLAKNLAESSTHVALGNGCVFRRTVPVSDRLNEVFAERNRSLAEENRLAEETLNGLLLPNGNAECISLILGPGVLRYMRAEAFAARDCEEIIQHLRARSAHPKAEYPFTSLYDRSDSSRLVSDFARVLDFRDLEAGFDELTWDDQLRQIHSVSRAFYEFGVPSRVLRVFNQFLGVRAFSVTECVEAWIPETYRDFRLSRSYLNSDDYLVLDNDCVFRKTEKVQQQLEEEKRRVEEEQRMAEQEKRKREVEQERIAESLNIQALQKSAFETFIYIMQDTRNRACKIGHSKTPSKRERTLQSEQPTTALRFAIPADESREKELHLIFATKRTRGEWFDLSSEEIITTIEFLKKHGDCTRAIADFEWIGRTYVEAGFDCNTDVR